MNHGKSRIRVTILTNCTNWRWNSSSGIGLTFVIALVRLVPLFAFVLLKKLHVPEEEIKANRGEKVAAPKACVHRTRPIAESLVEFENMKNGVYRPKEANLRMKQDLTDGNPQMWDLTAYRILTANHHRTHDRWKIYPTYDFTHCLVDSFENIS